MNKRAVKYISVVIASAAAVLSGIFLPGLLIKRISASDLGKTEAAPAKYYNASSFALSRNISEQMDSYDRLRLVSGSWESSLEEADEHEMSLRMHHAAAAARDCIEELYGKGLYPTSLSSKYGNWYNWQAEPYKAVDSVFNTYAAYYWKVTFQSIDRDERHTVYVLEDGTLIGARAYIPWSNIADRIADMHTVRLSDAAYAAAVYTRLPTYGLDAREWAALPDLEESETEWQWKDLVLITSQGGKSRYAMQFFSDRGYIFLIKV
ncbi:MAG: hypothetical protein NC223_09695 [Butyrivibrio sp.]|nr:hypothetical protein [Butyrivibrio sp.]